MNPSEYIQSAVDPVLLRRGRPLIPPTALDRPRMRRLCHAIDIPALTRQIPTVEICAGAALGLAGGFVVGLFRAGVLDLGWCMIYGTVLGLLVGWLIGTFTGATGTLSIRTVLANVLHILLVLAVAAIFVSIIGFLAALAGAAYGPDRHNH
jgi:small-conductance mechanosensitive channel